MKKSETASVAGTCERALEMILARVFVSAAAPTMAVAYSGGLDSSVLLHAVCDIAAKRGIALHAFHVHHGLSANADLWLEHCRRTCEHLHVAFDTRRVHVAGDLGTGLEASARRARYAALGEMCRAHGVQLLLTAHHQDDQVETVLLQMLRGAGLAGMSGMDVVNTAPELLGTETAIARPLLELSREKLAVFATATGIQHVDDESNLNVHHPRNALRNEVLPLLAKYFPAYRDCMTRSAQHIQSAQRQLEGLAAQDLVVCAAGDGLDMSCVQNLNVDRRANLLRHWLGTHGIRPPSSAWLAEASSQLLQARDDAQVCVKLDGVELRRYRNRILLVRSWRQPDVAPLEFRWQGEDSLAFSVCGGRLHFDRGVPGIDPAWLIAQTLRLQYRTGGGQLKLAPNRSGRNLKEHFQSLGVPAWERERRPLLYAGKMLVFVPGVGQDCRIPQSADGIRLRWEDDRIAEFKQAVK